MVTRLRKWWGLGARARGQALGAAVWLLIACGALRLIPYATVRRLVPRVPRSRRALMTAGECEVALRRGATVLPRSSCLARAVAAACLLRRSGRASVLSIGVGFTGTHAAGRDLQAHAWLESDGTLVVGAEQRGVYETLLRDAIPAPR